MEFDYNSVLNVIFLVYSIQKWHKVNTQNFYEEFASEFCALSQ